MFLIRAHDSLRNVCKLWRLMKCLSLPVLSLSIFVGGAGFAQPVTGGPVEQAAESELPSLLAIYKDVHSHPELSWHEERTSGLVAKELRAVGCDVTEHFGKSDNPNLKCYGAIAVMKNGGDPTVLMHTDLDALPVQEETGLPYASKVTTKDDAGKDVHVMHACGHDAHIRRSSVRHVHCSG